MNIMDNHTQFECSSPNKYIPQTTPEMVTRNATWLANSGPEVATVKTNSEYAVAPIKESPNIVHDNSPIGNGKGIKLFVKYENTPKIKAAIKFIPQDNRTGPIPSIPRIANVIFSKA